MVKCHENRAIFPFQSLFLHQTQIFFILLNIFSLVPDPSITAHISSFLSNSIKSGVGGIKNWGQSSCAREKQWQEKAIKIEYEIDTAVQGVSLPIEIATLISAYSIP